MWISYLPHQPCRRAEEGRGDYLDPRVLPGLLLFTHSVGVIYHQKPLEAVNSNSPGHTPGKVSTRPIPAAAQSHNIRPLYGLKRFGEQPGLIDAVGVT